MAKWQFYWNGKEGDWLAHALGMAGLHPDDPKRADVNLGRVYTPHAVAAHLEAAEQRGYDRAKREEADTSNKTLIMDPPLEGKELIRSLPGKVIKVDVDNKVALVEVLGQLFNFRFWDFQSGWPTTHPTKDDEVSVRFSKEGLLLNVRLNKA